MIIVGNSEMVALVGRRAMDRSKVATVQSEGEAVRANSMVCRVRAGSSLLLQRTQLGAVVMLFSAVLVPHCGSVRSRPRTVRRVILL
jgi:hypothetical protein